MTYAPQPQPRPLLSERELRDGAAKRLPHTQSVAGIPDRGRGGNNKKEQRNESGPKFINGRQAVGRYARIEWSSSASRGNGNEAFLSFDNLEDISKRSRSFEDAQ